MDRDSILRHGIVNTKTKRVVRLFPIFHPNSRAFYCVIGQQLKATFAFRLFSPQPLPKPLNHVQTITQGLVKTVGFFPVATGTELNY
jgi:hypothetical protein